jgi:hypothetical protein
VIARRTNLRRRSVLARQGTVNTCSHPPHPQRDTYGRSRLLYVVQPSATEDLGGGYIGGRVQLHLYSKGRMTSGPTAAEVEGALTAAGWLLERSLGHGYPLVSGGDETLQVESGVRRTTVRVMMGRGGYAWHPVAPRITGQPVEPSSRIPDLDGVVWAAASKLWRHDRPIAVNYDWRSGNVTEGDHGVTTARFTLGLVITPKPLKTDPESYRNHLAASAREVADQALASLTGKLLPGMGVVSNVEFDAEPFGMEGASFATIEVRFREVPGVEMSDEPEPVEDDDYAEDEDEDQDETPAPTDEDEDGEVRVNGLYFPFRSKKN